MGHNDIPAVRKAIEYVRKIADIEEGPVIASGLSSGGRATADLAASGEKNIRCIAPMSNEIREYSDPNHGEAAPLRPPNTYPKSTAAIFLHCPADKGREESIQQNLKQLKAMGVRTTDIPVPGCEHQSH